MTPQQQRSSYRAAKRGAFFEAKSMRFFGDTMRNFQLTRHSVCVETAKGDRLCCWELKRKKPVKKGLDAPVFFDVAMLNVVTGRRVERARN
jgi:hypothetical protein